MNIQVDRISKLGVIIFILAACFYIYDFFMQVLPSVITHQLMQAFAVNATVFGCVASIYFYTCAFMQIPAGLIVDRYGAYKLLAIMVFISALGILIFAFAPSLFYLGFARFLMGLGAAFAFICTLFLVGNWFPARYFALFAGFAQMIAAAGAIVGQAPLSYLVGQMGWRYAVACFALFGFVLLLLILLFVRDRPKSRQLQLPIENALNVVESAKIVFCHAQNWYLALYTFSIWAPVTTFAFLWGVPFLMVKEQLSSMAAASVIAAFWIGLAIGSPLLGWISNRYGYRKPMLIIPPILGLFSMLLIIFVHMPLAILYCLLFFVGLSSASVTLSFAVSRESNQLLVVSTASGFNNMATFLSGALLQPVIGKILDLSSVYHSVAEGHYLAIDYQYALGIILPICFLVGIVTAIFFIKETQCRQRVI